MQINLRKTIQSTKHQYQHLMRLTRQINVINKSIFTSLYLFSQLNPPRKQKKYPQVTCGYFLFNLKVIYSLHKDILYKSYPLQ